MKTVRKDVEGSTMVGGTGVKKYQCVFVCKREKRERDRKTGGELTVEIPECIANEY